MSSLLTRRRFVIGAAAATLVAGCDRVHPVAGFLRGMKDWNERFEELLFSGRHLAPEAASVGNNSRGCLPNLFHLQLNAGCTRSLGP